MMVFDVNFKESDGKKFYYFIPVHLYGDNRKVWISSKFVKFDEEFDKYIIDFPLKNATLAMTEKGTRKIVQGASTIVALRVEGGYRGDVAVKVRTPNVKFWEIIEYESPRGNLGENKILFIEFTEEEKIQIEYKKTGRLYGKAARGVIEVYRDGRIIDLEELPEEIDDLD
jgi:hypothetical protein